MSPLGILVPGGIEAVTLEQFDKQMNINTRSVYHLMQLALPHLLKTKGNIVNVSSVNGIRSVGWEEGGIVIIGFSLFHAIHNILSCFEYQKH